MAANRVIALSAEQTGLPWDIGTVKTAKCQNGHRVQFMFRRCKDCAKVLCKPCVDKYGFRHEGCEDDRTARGPFPSHAQESAITAHFGFDTMPRDASAPPERPEHAGWTWTPPTSVLTQYPGIALIGSSIAINANTAVVNPPNTQATPATGSMMTSASAMASVTPNTAQLSSNVPPTVPSSSQFQQNDASALLSAPEVADDVDGASAEQTQRMVDITAAATQEISDDGPSHQAATGQSLGRRRHESTMEDDGDEETEDNAHQQARRAELRRRVNAAPAESIQSDNAERSGGLQSLVDIATSAAEVEQAIAGAVAEESGINQERTIRIDVRGVDTIELRLQPGFRLGNPITPHNRTAPSTIPAHLHYQRQDGSNSAVTRETVATLQVEGTRVEVPATMPIGAAAPADRERSGDHDIEWQHILSVVQEDEDAES